MIAEYNQLYEILDKSFVRDQPQDTPLFMTRNDIASYEGNLFFESFNKKTWRQIACDEDFLTIKNAFAKNKTFGFFTPSGFAYYYPAFALYFAKFKDADLMQMCFFNITPGNSERSINRLGEIFSSLTDQEAEGVKASLLLLDQIWQSWGEKHNDAGVALEQYWNYV